MLNPLGLIIGIILIFVLKGKPLLWTGAALLLWTALAFVVPGFFDPDETSKAVSGLLIYFSMYGVFMGLPVGIICLIAGIIKRIKEKTANQGMDFTGKPPVE